MEQCINGEDIYRSITNRRCTHQRKVGHGEAAGICEGKIIG